MFERNQNWWLDISSSHCKQYFVDILSIEDAFDDAGTDNHFLYAIIWYSNVTYIKRSIINHHNSCPFFFIFVLLAIQGVGKGDHMALVKSAENS